MNAAAATGDLPRIYRSRNHGLMPENQDGLRLPIVVATTLPFFARATTIVDEVWHDLDRMAGALDQRAAELSADSADCAILALMTSGIREVARRLEQAEVALSACLPAP
jgi:hypothetical protein